MKATDLVKSLSFSSITSEDFKVATLYKGQNPGVFLVDNFGDGEVLNSKSLKSPSRNQFCVLKVTRVYSVVLLIP